MHKAQKEASQIWPPYSEVECNREGEWEAGARCPGKHGVTCQLTVRKLQQLKTSQYKPKHPIMPPKILSAQKIAIFKDIYKPTDSTACDTDSRMNNGAYGKPYCTSESLLPSLHIWQMWHLMRTVRLAAAVFNIPTMMNRYYWDITLMVNETVSKYLLNYGSIFLLHTTTVD